MKQLEEIYKKSFFGRRHKLSWRAPYVCNAIAGTFGLAAGAKIIDVGCAIGEYVREFNENGFDAEGIEGSMESQPYAVTDEIHYLDLRLPLPHLMPIYDVCMSLEVAEHIEPEYADQYVDNLAALSNTILVTAAPPGQEGHHHVNCQGKMYWQQKFWKHRFTRQMFTEELFRKLLAPVQHRKEIRAYVQNVMIFGR